MATKNPIGNYLEGERELPYEELFLAPEKKPFYKRAAKYIVPPLAGMTMLAGCATTRLYERVETLPDEVDVLNIDSRPQGAEVIYEGKSIGKTPMQVEVIFSLKERIAIQANEREGKTIEKVDSRNPWSEPSYHLLTVYLPGYFERKIEHFSDGKSNGGNYFEILKEDGNKPLIHQEQNIIIRQEGKVDKLGIK